MNFQRKLADTQFNWTKLKPQTVYKQNKWVQNICFMNFQRKLADTQFNWTKLKPQTVYKQNKTSMQAVTESVIYRMNTDKISRLLEVNFKPIFSPLTKMNMGGLFKDKKFVAHTFNSTTQLPLKHTWQQFSSHLNNQVVNTWM